MRSAISGRPAAKPGQRPSPTRPAAVSTAAAPQTSETRNFLVLAFYQVVMRSGWIFKTESIVMPLVLDMIGGAGWLRGCLPLLNRLGHSGPPLLAARRVKITPQKKWLLAACTLVMSAVFLGLSALWTLTGDQSPAPWWMPLAFLAAYAIFFQAVGVNQLCFGTLQGKLVRATRRGRLLLAANVVGAISAIVLASLLLPQWLTPETADFRFIFGFTGVCFLACAGVALLLAEPADNYREPRRGLARIFHGAAFTLARDRNFRLLATIAALFGSSIMLFPHYQALAREALNIDIGTLIFWVVIQNVGTAAFSLIAGPLADRFGNRLVIRCAMLGVFACPAAALVLAYVVPSGASVFYLVFAMIGLTPIVIKTLTNYTLELAEPADHPRYLSTLSVCLAAPMFCSPLVGLLVDAIGFPAVFIGIASLVLAGWLLSFFLQEPRHHLGDTATMAAGEP